MSIRKKTPPAAEAAEKPLEGVVIRRNPHARGGPIPQFCNPEWLAAYLDAVRSGIKPLHAAAGLGVEARTFQRWRKVAEDEREDIIQHQQDGEDEPAGTEFLQFLRETEAAWAVAIGQRERGLAQQSPEKWLAANVPDEYGPKAVPPPPRVLRFTFDIIAASGGIPLGTGEDDEDE